MKTSQTFLYDESTGNIQYINKKQFISDTITKLSKDQKKVFSFDEIKKINNFTYKEIIQEFDTSFKKLDKGIYSLKLNQSKIILICLLDKTTTDFEKFCKKNKLKFGQEVEKLNNIEKIKNNPQNQGIIYSKDRSINNILKYKSKESKEELKMKNKHIVKKVAVASLAALISIPNIVAPTPTYASIESDRASEGIESAGCTLYQIVSSSPYGNYTRIVDECGNDALVNTTQWNEYKALVAQGFSEVIMVDAGWSDETFYAIQGYQLAGQPKVNLPKDKLIKITDPYNCDHLSILKRVSGQLNSSQYLFNQTKKEQEIKENNAKIAADYAAERAKWAEMDKQVELGAIAAAERNIFSNDKNNHNSNLLYTMDSLKSYVITNANKSQEKLFASFDDERNYVQQWLTKNGFKDLKEVRDLAYKGDTKADLERGKKYYNQSRAAIQYFKDIENGNLPQNCSYGDWIRYNLNKSKMGGWNSLTLWTDYKNIDFTPVAESYLNHFMTYEDISKINMEVYNMIKQDLPIIANYTQLDQESRVQQVEGLANNMITPIATTGLAKECYPQYQSRYELQQKLINEWNTEYLPNIK